MFNIGICGAHGTGKTTLATQINQIYKLPQIIFLKNYWAELGVNDFEKLPKAVRTICQQQILSNSIDEEDKYMNGFVSDRTVIDYLAYTILDTDMSESSLAIYEKLVKERLQRYTHIIYCPIEFEVENMPLRANLDKRRGIDEIIKDYLDYWLGEKFLTVTGSVENRLKQIQAFVQ
jgi:adenylate kinase family enzyme